MSNGIIRYEYRHIHNKTLEPNNPYGAWCVIIYIKDIPSTCSFGSTKLEAGKRLKSRLKQCCSDDFHALAQTSNKTT